MPINSSALGRVVDVVVEVDTRWVLAYAAGLGFDRTLCLDDTRPGGPIVPPTFCVGLKWTLSGDRDHAPSKMTAKGKEMTTPFTQLLADVRSCTTCAAQLPLGPRPIIQIGKGARLVIIGQAPGSKVHSSGVPWQDDSGQRLREWLGITEAIFYDPDHVALLPMGLCYPGAANGADLPPRPECAPLWHERLLTQLPDKRLTLLVGMHAQARYLGTGKRVTLTDNVRGFRDHMPRLFPLPHPSWRSTGWMRRNPWYVDDVLPALRHAVSAALD